MTLPAELGVLQPLLPEIVLAAGGMLLLMLGAFVGDRATGAVNALSVLLLIGVAALLVWLPGDKLVAFNGTFVVDLFARFMKVLALAGSAIAILMSLDYMAAAGQRRFEYPILVVLSTLGMMLLVSAGDLIALYLGFELMSLCLYVLAAIQHNSVRAAEAGLKYFVLGALSSGMLLYGCSLIYGFTGTVSFAGIAQG